MVVLSLTESRFVYGLDTFIPGEWNNIRLASSSSATFIRTRDIRKRSQQRANLVAVRTCNNLFTAYYPRSTYPEYFAPRVIVQLRRFRFSVCEILSGRRFHPDQRHAVFTLDRPTHRHAFLVHAHLMRRADQYAVRVPAPRIRHCNHNNNNG